MLPPRAYACGPMSVDRCSLSAVHGPSSVVCNVWSFVSCLSFVVCRPWSSLFMLAHRFVPQELIGFLQHLERFACCLLPVETKVQ